MKIMIYNIKGGQGKTDISLNLALTLDFNMVTNEPLSPIELILEEGTFIKLERDELLPDLPDEYDIIYDFGGYLDKRAIKALKISDFVIVPVVNEFKDLHTTVNFIQEIEPYNKNIIIVANKTGKGDYENIKEAMEINYPQHPVLEIKKSRAMPNILKEGMSIRAMVEKGGLWGFNYRVINEQFNKLIEELKYGQKIRS